MKLEKKTKIIVGVIVCVALLAVTGGVYWMVKGKHNMICINCEKTAKKQEATEEKPADEKPPAGEAINNSTEEPPKTT